MAQHTANKYFDKIFVITSRDNFTRRPELKDELDGIDYEVFEECLGSELIPPPWWGCSRGAWGCFNSHMLIWHQLWRSDWENVLIFEDDAKLIKDFDRLLGEFMEEVPEEWDQIYLGGQHRKYAGIISPKVIKPVSINRTHCYAIRRSLVPKILRHSLEVEGYSKNGIPFDTQLEKAHTKNLWKVFTPSWWLVGQGANKSIIEGKDYEDRWWDKDQGYSKSMPFIWGDIKDPRVRNVKNSFIPLKMVDKVPAFRSRLEGLAKGAFISRKIPVVYGDDKVRDMVMRVRGHDSIHDFSEIGSLADYPRNNLFKHPWIS